MPDKAPLRGLDFFEASEFDRPNVLLASVRIVSGALVWTVGPEAGPGLLSSVQTEADPAADPQEYLEEVWRFIRNPYLWAVRVE